MWLGRGKVWGGGLFEGVQNAPHHSCSLIESRLPKCQMIHCVLIVELFQLVWLLK